ncbi:MAG TPA: SDR family oxidoreductase [Spirochaetia bacterium]|nr:SDR family oxidoreductase [Spirochaetia bacterium]
MKIDLSGQVALVTGAGRGIGRSIALALADAGADLFLTARTVEQLEEVAREIRGKSRRAEYRAADIGSATGVAGVFDELARRYGRLDVLVNNAGLGLAGPLMDFPEESFDTLMAVNVKGLFLCCQHAMRLMVPSKRGYIVNISSVVGFKGYLNQAAYAASKHAVMGITKSLAVEGQPNGIRVSAVLPGGVDTELMEALRPDVDRAALMRPEDIADAVLFLLSLSPTAAVDEIYIRRRSSSPF